MRPAAPAPNSKAIGGAGTSVGGPDDVPVEPELVEALVEELPLELPLDPDEPVELELPVELEEPVEEEEPVLPVEPVLPEPEPELLALDALEAEEAELAELALDPEVELELPPAEVLLDPLEVEALKKALPLDPPKKPPEKKPPPKPPPPLPPTTMAGTPPPISTGIGIGAGAASA